MWTSVDPARQFWNAYGYAGNGFNPINAIDPNGLTINDLDLESDQSIDLVTNATDKQWGGFEAYLDSKHDYAFADVYAEWQADGTIDYAGPANNILWLGDATPDQIGGNDFGGFGRAAHIHDIQYNYSGISRAWADINFSKNMKDAGSSYYSQAYFLAVRTLGWAFYKDAKNDPQKVTP